MTYATHTSAQAWADYLNSRPGYVPVSVHTCYGGWTIY